MFLSKPSRFSPGYDVAQWVQSGLPEVTPDPALLRDRLLNQQNKQLDSFYKMKPLFKLLANSSKVAYDRSKVLIEMGREYSEWSASPLDGQVDTPVSLRVDDSRPMDASSKGGRTLDDSD